MRLRPLTRKDVKITVEAEAESTPVDGNVMASGDDAADHALENEIVERLRRGDQWAWCCVKVTVAYGEWSESDYLGCCSYANEEDFRKDGYFDDMVNGCIEVLNASVRYAFWHIQPLILTEPGDG